MKQYLYNGHVYNSFWEMSNALPNFIFNENTPEELLKGMGIAIQEVEEHKPTEEEQVASVKKTKLKELERRFETSRNNATLLSSVGYKIDANPDAITNISGLLVTYGDNPQAKIQFCDADNQFHNVSINDIKTMQLEVAQLNQKLYSEKWVIREALEKATTLDDINKVSINFSIREEN